MGLSSGFSEFKHSFRLSQVQRGPLVQTFKHPNCVHNPNQPTRLLLYSHNNSLWNTVMATPSTPLVPRASVFPGSTLLWRSGALYSQFISSVGHTLYTELLICHLPIWRPRSCFWNSSWSIWRSWAEEGSRKHSGKYPRLGDGCPLCGAHFIYLQMAMLTEVSFRYSMDWGLWLSP